MSNPWPFAQWGLDIIGPFPKATRNKRYLLVGTDYFTKLVEAEPLANIKDINTKRFVWKNIVTRFKSLIPSFRTIDFSLTVKPLGGTVVT